MGSHSFYLTLVVQDQSDEGVDSYGSKYFIEVSSHLITVAPFYSAQNTAVFIIMAGVSHTTTNN